MALLSVSVLYYVVAIIAILFISVYMYFKNNYKHWKKLGIPYPGPEFPYGNFKLMLKTKETLGETITTCYNEMKAKGHKFFGIFFFHNPSFVAADPELIRSILSKDFAIFYDRGAYHDEKNDPLTASLFALEGQKWKNLRAKLSPTFTSGKMKKMFQTLVDTSIELKKCLNEPISKGEPIDIKKICVQFTTDVIGSCAFGIECNSFQNSDTEFIRTGRKAFQPTGIQKAKQFLAFAAPGIVKFFKFKVTDSELETFYVNLVKDTIEYREKNNITRNDFMQLLIQLKNKGTVEYDENDLENEKEDQGTEIFNFTMNSLTAQAFIFFVAGFETSSTAMTWALFEISSNQTIQTKAREEIIRVLKKHDGKITYDAIMEMRYIERIIQESLRKYPPIPFLHRIATEDYKIPETEIILKKGSTVFIPTLALHQDPEFYPNPDIFDPERFTEEGKASRPDYTWLPFGEGPRFCIGMRFAMLELKTGLCQLLLNYRFTVNSKTVVPPVFDPKAFVTTAKDTLYLDAERLIN